MPEIKSYFSRLKSLRKRKRASVGGSIPADNMATTNQQTVLDTTNQQTVVDATHRTTTFWLLNHTTSNNVHAYITGSAINHNNAVALIEADGKTVYFPTNPSSTLAQLKVDCAIPLGAPGSVRSVTVPQLAGGRLWFCVNDKLTFFLNPGPTGPALVEPSVTNPSDPNIHKRWDFCEFTFNTEQLFANITYVDFVCLPIALTLTNTSDHTQHVSGMDQNGFTKVVDGLRKQDDKDGAGWHKLIVNGPDGLPLRVLSPNSAISTDSTLFGNYWTEYARSVWLKFAATSLTINTQAAAGNVTGRISNGVLNFGNGNEFKEPDSRDIFSNSTGPFATTATTTPTGLAIIPRLAAAFNRSTLLTHADQPNGAPVDSFYRTSPTNHYSRIVHGANLDRKGYAFPYDDVAGDGQTGVAGTVFDGSPKSLTIGVGGHGAHT